MRKSIVWLAFLVVMLAPTRDQLSAGSARSVVRLSPRTMGGAEQFLFGGGPSEIVPGLHRPKKLGP
jgi:hypothetical protein